MEATKHFVVVMIASILAAGLVQAAEQPQAKLSNTRHASCLMKVTCDPAVLPLSFETIDYLLRSSAVGGKAAREALDVSPGRALELFTLGSMHEPTSGTPAKPPTGSSSTLAAEEQTYLFSLNVQLQSLEEKPAAEEFMDALIQNLRNALTRAFDEHTQKLKERLKLADEEAARAEHDLSDKQERLHVISDSRILDRSLVLNDMSNFRNDIQKIEMEQASDRVTVDATAKQIAEIKAKMQEEIDKDTVTKELRTMIDLNMLRIQKAKKLVDGGQGPAADSDLAEAWERLTKTRIELAQRREQLSKSAGGNLIESLNSQLVNYSIKATQNQVKLESLKQQLNQAENLLGKADDYELLSLKADVAKQNLQETILWRDRMTRQVRIIQPPTVSVVGGD